VEVLGTLIDFRKAANAAAMRRMGEAVARRGLIAWAAEWFAAARAKLAEAKGEQRS
jgi:hypothetical protein